MQVDEREKGWLVESLIHLGSDTGILVAGVWEYGVTLPEWLEGI